MSEPQFADPAVSRRKFDREIAEFRSHADEYRRRGWLLAEAEFPHALVILATAKTQPISILCGVWFDYSNYDAAPPSVRLVHPLTREPYKWSEVPTRLPRMPAPPGVAQALPPGVAQALPQGVAQALPQGVAQALPQGVAQAQLVVPIPLMQALRRRRHSFSVPSRRAGIPRASCPQRRPLVIAPDFRRGASCPAYLEVISKYGPETILGFEVEMTPKIRLLCGHSTGMSTFESIREFVVSGDLCDATDRQLREAGLDGNERFILWTGIVRDDRLLVRTIALPETDCLSPSQRVVRARRGGRASSAQRVVVRERRTTCHTGALAPHRSLSLGYRRRLPHGDDAWGLSLVVPDFARDGVRGPETALYRLSSTGWQELSPADARACPTQIGGLTLAIPDCFQRNAVAIAQAISGLDEQRLKARLADVCIGVTIGLDAGGEEGRAMADLLVRLLGRLYPSLVVREEGKGGVGEPDQCVGAPNQPAYRPVGAADNRGGRRYSASALEDRSNRVRGIQELERQAVDT